MIFILKCDRTKEKENQEQKDFEQLFISHFWIKTSTWSLKVHHAVQLLYSGNTNKTNKQKQKKHIIANQMFRRENNPISPLQNETLYVHSDISYEQEEKERGSVGR